MKVDMNKQHPYAAIDIGSNTIRLLCAYHHSHSHPLDSLKIFDRRLKIVRLGEGFDLSRRLAPSAMDRAVKALKDLSYVLPGYDPEFVHLIATGVVREAINQKEFIAMVNKEVGLNVRVLKGEEEAELNLVGARSTLPDISMPLAVCDIGGGSTELAILTADGDKPKFFSIPLGAVRIKERFDICAPMIKQIESMMNTFINKNLEDVFFAPEKDGNIQNPYSIKSVSGFASIKFENLIATAGVPTTLASIDQGLKIYDPVKVHGYSLRLSRIKEIYETLAALSLDERRCIDGLGQGREDIIIAGTAILICVMEKTGIDHLIVSEGGLLEGVLAQAYSKLSGIFPKIIRV
ncbi:Ppx/GppA family phosphatase [bacterium]|nr:Ppx/GppA family phosphatase [bacterium]